MSDQWLALLEVHKHWTIKTLNRKGQKRRYEVTIWGEGKRVIASGPTPRMAVDRTIAKLPSTRGEKTFKVVG